ncbi:MAG: hypothetical protein QNJ33_09315 [Crocosphaera sp.]|nr:hypothetical protein [Crocosphaera sp.]
MTRSNLNIFGNPTFDDSGGGEPLVNFNHVSQESDIIGTDITSDVVTVAQALEGLRQESLSNTQEQRGEMSVNDPLTGINQEQSLIFTDQDLEILDSSDPLYQEGDNGEYGLTGLGDYETVTLDLQPQEFVLSTTVAEPTNQLVFSDTETGVLDSVDQTHQGRYRDEYILRGLEDQQTVMLNLDSVGFGSSLQLINRETGELIDQYEGTETEGTSQTQLMFTSNNNIEYLVRVTSTGETTTGSYTLGTTLGELTLGISDQPIEGSITESDGTVDVWTISNSDVYEITHFSHFQTINIKLNSFDQTTMLLLIDADTGDHITSNIGHYNSEEGYYSANLNYTPKSDSNTNYAIVASFYQADRLGDYTLSVDTNFSLSGGFNSNHETVHPILKNRFMDNFLVSDLQVGEDVELNVNSHSSSHIVQLFNQDTGDVLQTTNEADLKFTVEEGVNYGVRILGQAGDTYDLTTNTGLLFDSNPIGLNQTITNSLDTSDATAYFKYFLSNHVYYSDGYYLSRESLNGETQVTITIENAEFLPDMYIINAQTGDIIDSYSYHGEVLSYDLNIDEGIDYLCLVTSRYNAQVGEYTFTVNSYSS